MLSTSSTDILNEVEELKPEFVEVLNALILLEQLGLFPLKSAGNIVLHYNDKKRLVKAVPSPHIKLRH